MHIFGFCLLWLEGIRHDDVLLFVTDAVPYMTKAANSLKVLYSKMVHAPVWHMQIIE
jgi:hypothetical protein